MFFTFLILQILSYFLLFLDALSKLAELRIKFWVKQVIFLVYKCFRLASFQSVSYFFFLYQLPFSSLCTVFDAVSSTIDEVLSINPSADVIKA